MPPQLQGNAFGKHSRPLMVRRRDFGLSHWPPYVWVILGAGLAAAAYVWGPSFIAALPASPHTSATLLQRSVATDDLSDASDVLDASDLPASPLDVQEPKSTARLADSTALPDCPPFPLRVQPQEGTQGYGNGSSNTVIRPQTPIKSLVILSRYAEELDWLTDPNTGLMDNSSGTPSFILPFEIYQASDIGHDGHPKFSGYEFLIDYYNNNNNSTTKGKPKYNLPMWPSWAWEWAWLKNATKSKAEPGTSQEAELLTKAQLGIPDHIPIGTEWKDIEERLAEWPKNTRPELKDVLFDAKPAKVEDLTNVEESNSAGNRIPSIANLTSLFSLKGRETIVLTPPVSPALPLRIVPNRGAEGMAYLTAIIDHYDEMADGQGPDLMIFAHAHRIAWHTLLSQDWSFRRLARSPPADPSLPTFNGYMPLACLERWRNDISHIFPTEIDANWQSNNGPRWHEALAGRYAQAWREHLGAAFGFPLPDYVRVPTAASFVATKQSILRRPKSFYVELRNWILETHIENKWLGIVLEFSWGITIANKTFINPSQEQCLCELYNVCTGYSEV